MIIDIFNTDRKYSVIYADPPWPYNDRKNPRGGAENHYETMTVNDIKSLPISILADEDCMLFLWTTFPFLPDALEVIKAWEFRYKTLGFSWIKTNKSNGRPFLGTGHYTRANCEVCLLALKGRPKVYNKSVSSAVIFPREEHSKKPDEVRDRIVELCGDVSRIELFARQEAEGWDAWDAWGDEV